MLTRDSNGHHGVSVGDADGDGLEDLYVAQPAGLPNRLLRARGDGTFEDVTDRAGVGLLDDTAQSLFADVDNDGDQDLVLATASSRCSSPTTARGRFTPVADAFRLDTPLQGVLTGIAMADYDRDGFLDLYLCVYSYFFGAGEDKAGTPMPYHDARNGPPGVLFRNDGRRRFVDVTGRRASTPATIATTSRRPGPTTTTTAGPICSSPTTSAPRTCIATSARGRRRCASRTSRRGRACSITAPA